MEEQKTKKEIEIECINKHVRELVYEKTQLKKAYNYYHCYRDAEQFRHVEENYGIGTPTSISFTPLMKKHIDVLVGEYLELDPELKVSCKDENTMSNILRDKKLKIDQALYDELKKQLNNIVINTFINNKENSIDPFIEKELEKIKRDIDKSYISEYEIAAQHILTYFRQSRDIDLKNKMRELFTDLLITGCCYFRTKNGEDNVKLEILNPIDTFIERNRNEFYLNKSHRCVIRRWLTKYQILQEFGEELSEEAINKLDDEINKETQNPNTIFVRAVNNVIVEGSSGTVSTRMLPTPGILGGLEVTPVFPNSQNGAYNYLNSSVVAVYEIEWLEYDKSSNKLVKHTGVKIGDDIYITRGFEKTEIDEDCDLSLNGMFFSDKNGSPFSIMLSTIDLQDKYDLLIYYRDNLIATSGTVGDWIDLAHIPSVLGVDLPEKLAKWAAYKKNGMALFDSSQAGTEMLNTTFNGYDDTIKAQSIQAIQLAINNIEMQCGAITGVFPEKLGGIQERDAVSNVKVGIKYSTLLTKQYFYTMDLMYKEVNYDMLNRAKTVFKKGLTGTLVLGNRYNQIFTALPEHYTVTKYDIHFNDSTEVLQEKETIKSFSSELIKANLADPEMIINIISAKSMTELKRYIEESMKTKKEENNQLVQLQQQLEQMDSARKQLEDEFRKVQQENSQLQQKIDKFAQDKINIEKKRVNLEEKSVYDKKDYNDKLIETKEKQVEVEMAQLYDDNPYNNKIKNVR